MNDIELIEIESRTLLRAIVNLGNLLYNKSTKQ
jgi:hypothetical protein